ncbi:MAG: hypothetical protein H7Y41_05345 [Hyphomonadaceae bacterium]|nr:hypothetical protein [Clostridia bacterium]
MGIQRNFIMLTPIEGGRGFAKIEQRDKAQKWTIQVQGVVNISKTEVYLLDSHAPDVTPYYLGEICFENGTGCLNEDLKRPAHAWDSIIISHDKKPVFSGNVKDWDVVQAYLSSTKPKEDVQTSTPESVVHNEAPIMEQEQTPVQAHPIVHDVASPAEDAISNNADATSEEPLTPEAYAQNMPEFFFTDDGTNRYMHADETPLNQTEIPVQDELPTQEDFPIEATEKQGKAMFEFNTPPLRAKWWLIRTFEFMFYDLGIPELPIKDYHTNCIKHMTAMYNLLTVHCVMKYGYYCIGFDRDTLIYAIPALYAIDPPALWYVYNHAKWMPVQKGEFKDGALGYWIMKINTKSGELLA